MPKPMHGFVNSKLRNKHFKKHVQGKGGGTNWVADMPNAYGSAAEYEKAGMTFLSEDPTWPPIVEILCPPDKVLRWNMQTDQFGIAQLVSSQWRLVTFHMRAPEPFLQALHLNR